MAEEDELKEEVIAVIESDGEVVVAAAVVEIIEPTSERGHHEAEVSVELLGDPQHHREQFRESKQESLLAVLDKGARKLKVHLLPNPETPLDHLRGVYEDHQVGVPLDLNLTLGEFLDQVPVTHHFAVDLVLAIRVNTQWRIAPEVEMTPKAILALFDLSWEQFSLYKADEAEPLPRDTPIHLKRGEHFEAQKDGKYGAGNDAKRQG